MAMHLEAVILSLFVDGYFDFIMNVSCGKMQQ